MYHWMASVFVALGLIDASPQSEGDCITGETTTAYAIVSIKSSVLLLNIRTVICILIIKRYSTPHVPGVNGILKRYRLRYL